MKQLIVKSILFFAACCTAAFGAHCYAEHLVTTVIENQIEQREDQIRAEMKVAIKDALKDKKTQEEVQHLLNDAVAKELETHGEEHVMSIIKKRYPRLMPFLQSMDETVGQGG